MSNHYNDPLIPNANGISGNSRNGNDASTQVQTEVINEIIREAKTYGLGSQDIANLLAIAKVESGFNPDAAAKSNHTSNDTSASGVFQITDTTAADATKRLSNTATDNHITLGTFNRFDYKSNIQYGIAIYLDKKRVAHGSNDVYNIYKAWNTNSKEYVPLFNQLENDAINNLNKLNSNALPLPGPAEALNTDTTNGDIVYIYAPAGYLTRVQQMLNESLLNVPTLDLQNFDLTGLIQNESQTTTNADGTSVISYSGTNGVINANNAKLTTDAQSSVTFIGSNNAAIGGTGSAITIGGNGQFSGDQLLDTVHMTNGGSVSFITGSRVNLYNDTASASTDVSAVAGGVNFGAFGGGIIAHAVAGDGAWIGNNGTFSSGTKDILYTTGIPGVTVAANTNANVISTDNSNLNVVVGANVYAGVSGGGNSTVAAQNGDAIWSPKATVNFAANAVGNVFDTSSGSGLTVNAAQGDSLAISGPGVTVNGALQSRLFISGTLNLPDKINSSENIFGTAIDGQPAGLVFDTGAYATINGGVNAFKCTGIGTNLTFINTSQGPNIGIGSQGNVTLGTGAQVEEVGNNNNYSGAGGNLFKIQGTYDPVNDKSTNGSTVDWFSPSGVFTGDSDPDLSDFLFDYNTAITTPTKSSGAAMSSAIVLNLQGGIVQTTNLESSKTYFDIENSGMQVKTAWAIPGEGILIFDPKDTHAVKQGASLVQGLTALSLMDSNRDGKIDSQDADWKDLRVWVDKTGSGKFEPGTMYSLDKLEISSIGLQQTNVNQDENGNRLIYDGTFTKIDGSTGDLATVNLAYDRTSVAKNNMLLASAAVTSEGQQIDGTTTGNNDAYISSSTAQLIQSMASFAPVSGANTTLPTNERPQHMQIMAPRTMPHYLAA